MKRSQYTDKQVAFALQRLRHLEEENARLRRLVADLSLDKGMLRGVVRKKL